MFRKYSYGYLLDEQTEQETESTGRTFRLLNRLLVQTSGRVRLARPHMYHVRAARRLKHVPRQRRSGEKKAAGGPKLDINVFRFFDEFPLPAPVYRNRRSWIAR